MGQNFLKDRNILDQIVEVTEIKDKNILEIGPGTGNLTSFILKKNPKKFFVIEKDNNLENSIKEFKKKNFSEFKEKLSEVLIENIEPISKEIKRLLNDKEYLDSILLEGSHKADKIASKKIKEMKELVGF